MKRQAVMAIAAGIAVLLSGCGGQEETAVQPEATQAPEKKVVVTCAGDCTLGTDVNFGGKTLPAVVREQEEDYSYFLRNVEPIFRKDDLTLVNLEGTLSTRGDREDKTFAFRGKPEYVQILTEGSVEAVTLANNHSRDYGEESFADTKEALRGAGIDYVYKEDVLVKEINGVKVGVIGLYDLDGSAEKTLEKAMPKVKEAGAQVVIAQIHWGEEGENTPEDSQRTLAKKIVDAGADLVIGHHPHVLQGVEKYNGKYIIYSLGNFCFGGNQNPRDKDTMIFQQTFRLDENGALIMDDDYRMIPCSISSVSSANNYQPTPLTGEEAERVSGKISRFSRELTDEKLKFTVFAEGKQEKMETSDGDAEAEPEATEETEETKETEQEKKSEKRTEPTPKPEKKESRDVTVL